MANEIEGANTSATSTAVDLKRELIAINDRLQPKKLWVMNGGMRVLTFGTGLEIDLEKRDRAVVIMVLTPEQAEQFRDGPTDITEIADELTAPA